MKRLKIIFVLSLFIFTKLLVAQDSAGKIELKDGKFFQDSVPFYPMVLNYQMDICTDDEKNFWLSPHHGYSNDNARCCHTETDALMALFSDFIKIKELGFNTIRLCGLEMFSSSRKSDKRMCFLSKKGTDLENVEIVYNPNYGEILADLVKKVIDEAQDAGLKVILLSGKSQLQRDKISKQYALWLDILTKKLNNCNNILAYDLYNEPVYSTSISFSKKEVAKVSEMWYKTVRKNDKNTLITYGLMGHEDVLIWDPSIVKCDFLSFHLYPNSQNFRFVEASINWISNNIDKTWIIGETGFSGTNRESEYKSWGDAQKQKDYAEFILKHAYCCGAAGFSWWVYKDVFWGSEQNWFGILDYDQKEKPVAEVFKNKISEIQCRGCNQADEMHYYRKTDCTYSVSGTVEDEKGKPIEDAVIYAWNNKWQKHVFTFSDKWGSFQLCSPDKIAYLKVSAMRRDSVHKLINLRDKNSRNIGRIELKPLKIK